MALAAYHGPPQLCVSPNGRWVWGTKWGGMGEESAPIKVNAHKGVIRGASFLDWTLNVLGLIYAENVYTLVELI